MSAMLSPARLRGIHRFQSPGAEFLLGSVPLDEMDLWVSPAFHKLVPNPLSPDVPMSVAKGFRSLRKP